MSLLLLEEPSLIITRCNGSSLTLPGNISTPPPPPSENDLLTPTLKEDVYTTGRGGSGNMAKNVGKEGARRAQDVIAWVSLLVPMRCKQITCLRCGDL